MKLLQQLLVAPAAVGLLATGASAANLNINGVSDYADDPFDELEQVTSITQFSTTTKLKVKTVWVTGATHALGDNFRTEKVGERQRSACNSEFGAFSFSYDLRFGLKTSFTGKDLLLTRLRAGNMGDASPWDGNGVSMNKLDTAAPSAKAAPSRPVL